MGAGNARCIDQAAAAGVGWRPRHAGALRPSRICTTSFREEPQRLVPATLLASGGGVGVGVGVGGVRIGGGMAVRRRPAARQAASAASAAAASRRRARRQA